MEIVPPVAGSQGFSLWIPPLYVDIAAGVTEGLGTGSVRPLFGARRGSNPWLIGDARDWLVRACGRGLRRRRGGGTTNAVYSRAESRVSSAAPCCFIHWATFLNFSRRRGSGWTFAASC